MTGYALVLAVLGIAMAIAIYRLLAGPTLPDRVVALDLIGNLAVGLIIVYAVAFDLPALMQPALIIALLAFIGTVAFARYLERPPK